MVTPTSNIFFEVPGYRFLFGRSKVGKLFSRLFLRSDDQELLSTDVTLLIYDFDVFSVRIIHQSSKIGFVDE
jgi:hypothetical protein